MTLHYIYDQANYMKGWTQFSIKGIERLRQRYIRLGKLWLDGRIPTPTVPQEFRANWQKSLLTWAATSGLQGKGTRQMLAQQNKPSMKFQFLDE